MRSLLLAVALGLWCAPAQAQFEQAPEPPEWKWRQVLSIPRTGGRLRSIAVDPTNPNKIYLGTEESTVLITEDGGKTWEEIDLYISTVGERSVGIQVPGLPQLGKRTRNNFKIFVDPPWQRFTHRIPIPSVANPFPVKPDFFFAGFLAESPLPPVTVLTDVTRIRRRETIPVYRIGICPGSVYPLIVATWADVLGSRDNGRTWVRLFANAGRTPIDHVVCSAKDPMKLAVATGIGLFVSEDGGLTFDQDLTAWPGQRATAVAYGPGKNQGAEWLYSASGSELFAGALDNAQGLDNIYPSGGASTAPWLPIRWVAPTARGGVWLATDDGARYSPDHGKTWKTVARTLMSRQTIKQVEVGEGDKPGVERVAIMLNQVPRTLKGTAVSKLHDSQVYASDDEGETWYPFFFGLSRRTFRQMTATPTTDEHPSAWWMVTSGELWTTYPAKTVNNPHREAQRWAKERLAAMPPLYFVVQAVLHKAGLSNEKIYEMAERHRLLNWIPRMDLLFDTWEDRFLQVQNSDGSYTLRLDNEEAQRRIHFFVQASWDLMDTLIFTEETYPIRKRLHQLRQRVALTTEDAWHERAQILENLAHGLSDPIEVQTALIRIETLEAMLDLWLGHPVEQTLQEPLQ